jgi:uncharacterized protein (TIGR02266 family)
LIEEGEGMSNCCPYCAKEVPATEIRCPSCGTTYGFETLMLLKSVVKASLEGPPAEIRKHQRMDKRFKIVYPTADAFRRDYLRNISKGGVFIEARDPLEKGETFNLRISLPDSGSDLEVLCEVVWSREKEVVTPRGKHPQGMGIRFLNLGAEGQERIQKLLNQTAN